MSTITRILIVSVSLSTVVAVGQTSEEQKRIGEIRAKRDRGEALSDADRAFVQRMMAMRKQPAAQRNGFRPTRLATRRA